ncbi:apolipoprotein N-acyltransferase [Streptomyces fulvorobeus]|uniref:Apolipoprotein N-acyltransferase n=1 Tax=Streptomyces fulvorobeus TaxID=284028 RepID=A0A7Y9KUQ4_9ACTN|nr:apolipoprotein N-acyltransferase [Streptomyces fulvorobeus]
MVHATLTGTSAVYGPGGGEKVGAPLGTDVSAAAVFDVPLTTGTTLHVRVGDWAVYAALALPAGLGAAEGLRLLRRPAPGSPAALARTARGWPARPGR